MICKNCQFYIPQEKTEYFSGQYGDCDNPKFTRDNDVGPRNTENHFADEGESFGCIHFKQKSE